MLTELRVSNFALIEQLHLTFPPGFVALTGETGAGKSLLVDALSLLLGQRATGDHIRTGADEAELEAAFLLPPGSELIARLQTADLIQPSATEVIVRRVLSRSGRGRSYLNGRLVALQELEQFAGLLVDLHGQHEQQSLLAPAAQLDAVDHFGRLEALRGQYELAFARWAKSTRLLEEAKAQAKVLQEREDLLRYQAREIRDAVLQPGEDEALKDRCRRLGYAERLRALTEHAYEVLYGGEGALVEQIAAVGRDLKDLAAIDRQVEAWWQQFDQAAVVVREVTGALRRFREGLQDDPAQLTELENRLAHLELLKKKYGGTLEAVREKGDQLEAEVARLEQSQEYVEELSAKAEEGLLEARALAARLSEQRRGVISKFEEAVKSEFGALRLENAHLTVRIESLTEPSTLGPAGQDRVQFLFSANAGEECHPLARVVSGGECSRVMLALKTVLAAHDSVPVLIFDEIDAGVGGVVGKAIGTRLRNLSRYHQVLCVTHLPQVASQAQAQILVEKTVKAKRTVTIARRLDREGREEAIAKMLGGQTVTPTMRRAAAELLRAAERMG